MILYTLTMQRKKIVYHRDGSVVETMIPEVSHGVPLALALSCRRDFPHAFVTMVPEAVEQRPWNHHREYRIRESEVADGSRKRAPAAAASEFRADGFAEAINAALEEDHGE